ncbi:MAG TPA: hypothetical protein VHK27_06500, partial [Gammaproteobacteria bacterium]|nr:hypothetical protein [Gammaproteobacteria bacterium]
MWESVEYAPRDGYAALVKFRSLQIRTENVPIIGVDGLDLTPVLRHSHEVEFEGSPGWVWIKLAGGTLSSAGIWSSPSRNFWLFGIALPWLVLLIGARNSRHRLRGPLQLAAIAYLGGGTVLAVTAVMHRSAWNVFLGMSFIVTPVMAISWIRSLRGAPAFGIGTRWAAGGVAFAACVTAVLIVPWTWQTVTLVVAATMVAIACLAGAAAFIRQPGTVVFAVLTGLAFVPGTLAITFLYNHQDHRYGGLALIALGTSFAALPGIELVRLARTRRGRLWSVIVVLIGALSFVPLGSMLAHPWRTLVEISKVSEPMDQNEFASNVGWVVLFGLVVVLIVVLHQYAAEPDALAEPLMRAAAIAVVVAIILPGYLRFPGRTVAVIAMAVALLWLIPRKRLARAARLARVSPRAHSRLINAEIWQRLSERTAEALYRTGPSRVASGETSLADIRAKWFTSGFRKPPSPNSVPLVEAALGSGAGHTPRQNALVAAAASTLLATATIWYEASLTLYGTQTKFSGIRTIELIVESDFLRWVAYGALFGLFYTGIRGGRPLTKAGYLLVAILLFELLAIITTPYSTPYAIAYAMAIRAGQAAVLCIGLGLFWEWRLAQAAGVPWRYIRSFRTVSALAAPVTAISVAAAT